MGARPLPGHVCGEMVRVALMKARPEGLTLPQLVAATSLSARAGPHRAAVDPHV
ncbi:hypothetical protein [Nocardia terpenica]|uniref:Uncharacterized protein n=1 Tax=Nocardia terpenica TaxID=455432 RepID=A0A6G9ZD64_9NOCA|nr:hypothetical protein [Nocardia terpenica]QIS23555.1 hypothetical protein F6W96_40015 [Nocardia terpenica]